MLAHRCFSCVACSDCIPTRGVGIHDRAGAELSRVQRIGALQKDYDLAVGVPPLVCELVGDVRRERLDDLLPISRHPLEIRGAEQDRVAVGGEQPPPREFRDVLLGLSEQRLSDLLRDDAPTENAREGIAHHLVQTAFQPSDGAQPIFLRSPTACC